MVIMLTLVRRPEKPGQILMPEKTSDNFWLPLDNAAKIFPAIRSKEHSTVIRLTAFLQDRILISALLRAVEMAGNRFPFFKVGLRRGFFWYYLEQVDDPIKVVPDSGLPCKAFGRNAHNRLLCRVLAGRKKVSVEFSHILTDGYGVLTFLKTVLIFYFLELGLIKQDQIDPFFTSEPDEEETEDAYNRYFRGDIPNVIRQPAAFHLPFPLRKKPRFGLLYAKLSAGQLHDLAKSYGVSITDYLVAVYLLIIQDIYTDHLKMGNSVRKHITRIQVPVNLRKIFQTRTLRNFSLFVLPEIDFRLGRYSFDEIVKIVYHRMQLETDEKLISKIISRNVGGERNLLVRGIPIWLKSLVLYMKYYSEGAAQYSGVVTNLGKVDLPDAIRQHVDFLVLTPPPPNRKLKLNCGVIGYGDDLLMSFGNITRSRDFERRYLHYLSSQGIRVHLIK